MMKREEVEKNSNDSSVYDHKDALISRLTCENESLRKEILNPDQKLDAINEQIRIKIAAMVKKNEFLDARKKGIDTAMNF